MERFKRNSLVSGMIVVVCFGLVLISGCATTPTGKGPVATLKVCPTAEITTLTYFMKEPEIGGGPKLHFKIGIKNTSDKPRRYDLSVSLPEGPSAGGFYPKTGKIPVLKPGEELVRVFRLYFDRVPDALTIKVDEA